MGKRILCWYCLIVAGLFSQETKSETPIYAAKLMAKQLSFGLKRSTYYLESLLEQCNNIPDIAEWFVFIESYFKCDTNAKPKLTQENTSVQRLDDVCASWPVRRKCSKRLASRMNSCLDSQIESGQAGSNALHLTDAHMKFVCNHKLEYSKILNGEMEVPVEKMHMSCYKNMEAPLEECINRYGNSIKIESPFCKKFRTVKECLLEVSMEYCGNSEAKHFMQKMLKHIDRSLQCTSNNIA